MEDLTSCHSSRLGRSPFRTGSLPLLPILSPNCSLVMHRVVTTLALCTTECISRQGLSMNRCSHRYMAHRPLLSSLSQARQSSRRPQVNLRECRHDSRKLRLSSSCNKLSSKRMSHRPKANYYKVCSPPRDTSNHP